ncbi:substrate-binding periplasmic protein [Allohahella sp. A8]|uniref:substrate-binding periplasmic protein n=1 Tax=Allohahella sp. A8 TaxID=3141461 RepID=UPI003A7FCF67
MSIIPVIRFCERLVVSVLSSMIVGSALVHAAKKLDAPCALRVGWEDWSPYIYRENGGLAGEEYRLLEQLANAAQCELIYIDVPWVRGLTLLEQQKIDMLYAATRTPGREKYARFSVPYRFEHMRLITRTVSAEEDRVKSLKAWLSQSSVQGSRNRLGVVRGSHYGDSLESTYRAFGSDQIIEVGSDDQLLEMLRIGRIEGYLVEDLVAIEHVGQASAALSVYVISEAVPEPMQLMFGLHVPETIVHRFDAAISALLNEGQLGSKAPNRRADVTQ